jgi:hypothetical protein
MGRWLRHLAVAAAAALAAGAAVAQQPPELLVREASAEAQAAVRAELGSGFRLLETDHFRVISDTSPRYHRMVGGVLEQFYQLVHPRFFEREMAPLPFYLIDGGTDFARFMTARGLPNADGYGLYEADSRVLYARRYFPDGRESGVGTLFHEVMHAMLHAEFGPAMPAAWFNEGFASLFEQGRVLRGQWVYGNPNPWREAPFRVAFEAGEVPALARLLRAPDSAFGLEAAQRNTWYNAGRSLFLSVLLQQGEPALRAFVQSLRAGAAPERALEKATGLPLAQVESQWHRSIREVNYGGDYLERGSRPDGFAILVEGARLHPGYGNLRAQLAAAYLARRDRDAAVLHARAALKDPRCTIPQFALSVLAEAILQKDPNEAARSLAESLRYQPWNEQVMQREYEMLAWMNQKMGYTDREQALRSELARLQALDRKAAP